MYCDIHTHHLDPFSISIYNANREEKLPTSGWYSLGIHPWAVADASTNALNELASLVNDPRCWAIGECGLDKAVEQDLTRQIAFFEAQIALAIQHHKPLIVHTVRAYDVLLGIIKKYKNEAVFILHGFAQNQQVMQAFVDAACYISFGKALLDKPKLQEAFINCPIEQIFLETDNQRKPSIHNLYEQAAKLKNISLASLQQAIMNNFNTITNKTWIG